MIWPWNRRPGSRFIGRRRRNVNVIIERVDQPIHILVKTEITDLESIAP